ncbi:MAG: hypothetical protein M3P11_04940 [Actinomycetota bacterium]|nr:hypothetical protein [Actinomycetota bacterium]
MLRQLARLTQPLPAAGPKAVAVAVYTDPADRLISAKESGTEGVACVDDAARVLDVLCDVWARTRLDWVEGWARGLLEFVLWMQEDDGRWINFVYDWEGTRNVDGITSLRGENFWHARALMAVSHAWLTFKDVRAEDALYRGLDHAVKKPAPADVRVLHMEVARRLIVDAERTTLLPALRLWAEEISSCRADGILMNSSTETGTPHLWAHLQEGALAEAGALLDESSFVDVARASALQLFVPIVRSGFDLPNVTPYDVASSVFALARLGLVTGDHSWAELASDARAWFNGRNPTGRPVYDRERGRVADGIDNGRISENSGAEANVAAADALLDDAVACARSMRGLRV